jgi:hypothetical protein
MSKARTMGGWVIKSDTDASYVRCTNGGKKMHDRNEREADNRVVVGVTHG